MKLTSPAFEHNQKIPSKYTCDGDNVSPPLKIEEVPEGAKSLVLIMDDPDIPDFVAQKIGKNVWDHWVVFNINPQTSEIMEGQNPEGILGKNTGGENKYMGPCPPDKQHRYFFKLYALSEMLSLQEGATKEQVEEAMQNKILEKTEMVGLYERGH
jgi:Raf kinase inhibitor-like YbhB/YbcL family protein